MDQLDLDLNLAVVQTVLVVEDRLRVVDQRQGLVADLVRQSVMDCPLARQNFDLNLVPAGLLPGLLPGLVGLVDLLTLVDQRLVLVVAEQD
jgi:hypothetical protein